jgi:energy-coupling factor transporter ATP-binding protein EcfA2
MWMDRKSLSYAKWLEAISVEGFKSIRDRQHIALRPITVLAGPNSSGKSSFMQALLLIKQTQEEQANYGPLLLSGPQVTFRNYRELFWRHGEGSKPPVYSVGMMMVDDFWYQQSYKLGQKSGTDAEIVLSECEFHEEFRGKWEDCIFKRDSLVGVSDLPHFERHAFSRVQGPMKVTSEKGFMILEEQKPKRAADRTESWRPCVLHPMSPLADLLRDTIHLPGLRGYPAREYELAYSGGWSQESRRGSYPGSFLTYVAGLLYNWSNSKISDDVKKIARLNGYLLRLGFTSGINVKRVSDTAAEIQVQRVMSGHPDASDMVSIADVGLGLSQTLPVLVGLLAAHEGGLVHIEQPEIHLHPRAQYDLASIVADATKYTRARAVIETHSPLFILGIQTLVAEGKIKASDVSLNWFSRDKDGATSVTTTELDDRGRFGDWPEDFDEVSLLAEKEYMMAQMKLRGRGDHEA